MAEGLRELFVMYHETLVSDAKRQVPASDAEDVVMSLWASQPVIRPGLEPLRCLRASLRQQIASHRLKAVPEPLEVEEGHKQCWRALPMGAPELVNLQEQIAHCLTYLRPRQARALDLVYLQGLSQAEAGISMKISENAVATLVSRSLSHLKRCLKEAA